MPPASPLALSDLAAPSPGRPRSSSVSGLTRLPRLPGFRRQAALPASRLAPAHRSSFGSRRSPLLLPLLLPALLLALWQLAASQAWLSAQVLPAPAFVWDSFLELWRNGDIGSALIISLHRIALGFGAGAVTGLAMGIVLATSDRFRSYVEPLLKALFAVPSIGWIPILILIFGVDEALKVLIIAKAVFVPFVINTQQGIRDIPVAYREAAAVLHLTRWTRLTRLTLPAALPALFSGFRLGLSHAFIALVVVEMLAATEGIGYLMVWGRKLFQIDVVIVGMVLVGILGVALDTILRRAERRLSRWTVRA